MTETKRNSTVGHGSTMPSTHWSKHGVVRGAGSSEKRTALDFLLGRYWKPVYCYVRRKGVDEESAKDLTQEFFTDCLSLDLFGKAEPSRGRFRNLLLESLENSLHNQHRREQAQKRRPVISLTVES